MICLGRVIHIGNLTGAVDDVTIFGQKFDEIFSLNRKQADLTDPMACAKFIIKNKFSAVINAAAYTSVDKAEDEAVINNIQEMLESRIKPAADQMGGEINYKGYRDGIVYVEFIGPTTALTQGMENILSHYVHEVTAVRDFRDAIPKPGLDSDEAKEVLKVLEEKMQRLDAAKKKYNATKDRLQREIEIQDNLEKGNKISVNEFKESENMMNEVVKEIRELKETLFKDSQKLFKLRADQANLIGDISGTLSASRNL